MEKSAGCTNPHLLIRGPNTESLAENMDSVEIIGSKIENRMQLHVLINI